MVENEVSELGSLRSGFMMHLVTFLNCHDSIHDKRNFREKGLILVQILKMQSVVAEQSSRHEFEVACHILSSQEAKTEREVTVPSLVSLLLQSGSPASQ